MRLRATILCIISILSSLSMTAISQPAVSKAEHTSNQAEPYVINLKANDYAFAMPTVIKSGWVTFRFKNIGKEVHYGIINKINKRHSWEEVSQWKQRYEAFEYFRMMAEDEDETMVIREPGFQSAGKQSEVTIKLEPGNYYMVCAAKTPDGKAHLVLEMDKFFRVTNTPSHAPEPKADATFTLKPYHVEYEGSLQVGKLADFTIFDQDIMRIPEEDILDTKVSMTIVGGKVVYERIDI